MAQIPKKDQFDKLRAALTQQRIDYRIEDREDGGYSLVVDSKTKMQPGQKFHNPYWRFDIQVGNGALGDAYTVNNRVVAGEYRIVNQDGDSYFVPAEESVAQMIASGVRQRSKSSVTALLQSFEQLPYSAGSALSSIKSPALFAEVTGTVPVFPDFERRQGLGIDDFSSRVVTPGNPTKPASLKNDREVASYQKFSGFSGALDTFLRRNKLLAGEGGISSIDLESRASHAQGHAVGNYLGNNGDGRQSTLQSFLVTSPRYLDYVPGFGSDGAANGDIHSIPMEAMSKKRWDPFKLAKRVRSPKEQFTVRSNASGWDNDRRVGTVAFMRNGVGGGAAIAAQKWLDADILSAQRQTVVPLPVTNLATMRLHNSLVNRASNQTGVGHYTQKPIPLADFGEGADRTIASMDASSYKGRSIHSVALTLGYDEMTTQILEKSLPNTHIGFIKPAVMHQDRGAQNAIAEYLSAQTGVKTMWGAKASDETGLFVEYQNILGNDSLKTNSIKAFYRQDGHVGPLLEKAGVVAGISHDDVKMVEPMNVVKGLLSTRDPRFHPARDVLLGTNLLNKKLTSADIAGLENSEGYHKALAMMESPEFRQNFLAASGLDEKDFGELPYFMPLDGMTSTNEWRSKKSQPINNDMFGSLVKQSPELAKEIIEAQGRRGNPRFEFIASLENVGTDIKPLSEPKGGYSFSVSRGMTPESIRAALTEVDSYMQGAMFKIGHQTMPSARAVMSMVGSPGQNGIVENYLAAVKGGDIDGEDENSESGTVGQARNRGTYTKHFRMGLRGMLENSDELKKGLGSIDAIGGVYGQYTFGSKPDEIVIGPGEASQIAKNLGVSTQAVIDHIQQGDAIGAYGRFPHIGNNLAIGKMSYSENLTGMRVHESAATLFQGDWDADKMGSWMLATTDADGKIQNFQSAKSAYIDYKKGGGVIGESVRAMWALTDRSKFSAKLKEIENAMPNASMSDKQKAFLYGDESSGISAYNEPIRGTSNSANPLAEIASARSGAKGNLLTNLFGKGSGRHKYNVSDVVSGFLSFASGKKNMGIKNLLDVAARNFDSGVGKDAFDRAFPQYAQDLGRIIADGDKDGFGAASFALHSPYPKTLDFGKLDGDMQNAYTGFNANVDPREVNTYAKSMARGMLHEGVDVETIASLMATGDTTDARVASMQSIATAIRQDGDIYQAPAAGSELSKMFAASTYNNMVSRATGSKAQLDSVRSMAGENAIVNDQIVRRKRSSSAEYMSSLLRDPLGTGKSIIQNAVKNFVPSEILSNVSSRADSHNFKPAESYGRQSRSYYGTASDPNMPVGKSYQTKAEKSSEGSRQLAAAKTGSSGGGSKKPPPPKVPTDIPEPEFGPEWHDESVPPSASPPDPTTLAPTTPTPAPAATPAATPAPTPAPTPAATPAATPAPTPAATPAPTPAATTAAAAATTAAAKSAATPASLPVSPPSTASMQAAQQNIAAVQAQHGYSTRRQARGGSFDVGGHNTHMLLSQMISATGTFTGRTAIDLIKADPNNLNAYRGAGAAGISLIGSYEELNTVGMLGKNGKPRVSAIAETRQKLMGFLTRNDLNPNVDAWAKSVIPQALGHLDATMRQAMTPNQSQATNVAQGVVSQTGPLANLIKSVGSSGAPNAAVSEILKTFSENLQKVSKNLVDVNTGLEGMIKSQDDFIETVNTHKSDAQDLNRSASALAKALPKNEDAKALITQARLLASGSIESLDKDGTVGAAGIEKFGRSAFDRAHQGAGFGERIAKRLTNAYLGVQVAHAARFTFYPIEQAAWSTVAKDAERTAIMAPSGSGFNAKDSPMGQVAANLSRFQTSMGRTASSLLSGVLGTSNLVAGGVGGAVASGAASALAPALGTAMVAGTFGFGPAGAVGAGLAVGGASLWSGISGAMNSPRDYALSRIAYEQTGNYWNSGNFFGGIAAYLKDQDPNRMSFSEGSPNSNLSPADKNSILDELKANAQSINERYRIDREELTQRYFDGVLSQEDLSVQEKALGQKRQSDLSANRVKGYKLSIDNALMPWRSVGIQYAGEESGEKSKEQKFADQYRAIADQIKSGSVNYGKMTSEDTRGFFDLLMQTQGNSVIDAMRESGATDDDISTAFAYEARLSRNKGNVKFGSVARSILSRSQKGENIEETISLANRLYGAQTGSANLFGGSSLIQSSLSQEDMQSRYASIQQLGGRTGIRALAMMSPALAGTAKKMIDNRAGYDERQIENMGLLASGDPTAVSIMAAKTGMGPTAGMPLVDLSNGGIPLFARSMYGLNGAGSPNDSQVMSFMQSNSVNLARGSSYQPGASGYAGAGFRGRMLNAVQGRTFGVGGQAGLQYLANQVQFEGTMASAGAQIAQIKAQYRYLTSVQQPAEQANMEFARAADFGGTVNTPFMQKNGISAANFGKGRIAWQKEELALSIAGAIASQKQQRIQFGWQSAQIGREQYRDDQQYGWQQMDFGFKAQGMQLGRRQQMYQFGFQRRELALSAQYSREDFAFDKGMRQLQFGWQMEDFDTNIRRSTGFQRRQLVKERERATQTYNLQSGQADRLQDREQGSIKRQEEKLGKELKHFQQMNKLEDAQFAEEKKRAEEQKAWRNEDFAVRRSQLAQEMQWSEEAFVRTTASFEIRKEQMAADESATKTQHELKFVMFDFEKAHQAEMYKLNLAAAGVSIDTAKKMKEINDLQAGMAEKDAERQISLQKFIFDVRWDAFARIVEQLIILTKGGGLPYGGTAPDDRGGTVTAPRQQTPVSDASDRNRSQPAPRTIQTTIQIDGRTVATALTPAVVADNNRTYYP
jgi:hypothetical protein